MKIKGLNITAYGKLQNQNIKICDGLTVFFGANESGKTTIKNFILDMFFGGTIPGSKIARYTPKHQSYKPWSSPQFEGSMLVEHKGENYHFHRNFTRGSESFSIRDINTGLDQKPVFNVDTRPKVELLDESFFGITESNIRNTFLIDNAEEKDSTIGPDLRDRMINAMRTKREDLSVRDIIDRIDSIYLGNDHIKERRHLNREIEELKTQIQYLPSSLEYDETIREIDILNRQIKDLEIQIEDEKMATQDKIIIDNPQYIESLIYQQERLSTKGEELEVEKATYNRDLRRVLKLRPVVLFVVAVVVLLALFFKVYFLLAAVLAIGLLESYKNTLENKIYDIDEEIKKVYYSLDNILEKANKYQQDSMEQENPQITALNTERESLACQRERLLERVRILDINIQKEIELGEKLHLLQNRFDQLMFIEEMANTAKDTIERISKDNFNSVSERLIRIASENLSYITDGRYTRLLISDTGVITLYDSDIDNYVEVDDLSRGTLEQVYLSYKIAVIESLGVDFPIMLDDTFAFYDQERRHRTLMLLSEIAKKRQIFYFTSNVEDLMYLEDHTDCDVVTLGD